MENNDFDSFILREQFLDQDSYLSNAEKLLAFHGIPLPLSWMVWFVLVTNDTYRIDEQELQHLSKHIQNGLRIS